MSHHCAGCSTTAGMAGCPEHGRHSWSSSQVVVTHCQHGLDLRIHPRCYLCEPAATPAPLDVGPRLMAAVRAVIADGIDSPGVHNELHAAYYEARDHATPAPLDVERLARAIHPHSCGDWHVNGVKRCERDAAVIAAAYTEEVTR